MRWIIRIAITLITLVVLAVAGLFLIPTAKIARFAEGQFEKNTGRALSIAGDVSPQIFPRLGVKLEDVAISNAEWSGKGPMLEAASMEMGVGFSALLGGDIVVEAFDIQSPVIRLEKSKDGKANWDFVTELGGGEDGGGSADVSLPLAQITNGSVEYVDAQAGQSYVLTALDATVKLLDLKGAGRVEMSGLYKGQSVKLAATINGVQQLLDGGVQGVDMTASAGGNSVSFEGSAGLDPVQAKGAMTGSVVDQTALFALMDQAAPRIPEGLGQKVKVSGELTLTADNQVFLRGATIDLDQNRLTGALDVTLKDTPHVTARLQGDSLDFSAMSTDTSEGDGAANAGAGGWSDARIDVSGLSGVNGEFSLKANAIDLGSIQLARTDLSGSLDRARLVLDLANVGVFDGGVSGQFVVNGRGGLSVGGDLKASSVAMQRLLNDFAGFDRLVGDASMSLQFLGVGSTMNEIMNGLKGSGRLDVGSGELLGLDIAGMIKNLDASYQGEGSKTVFDDITASFTIEGGVLSNSDLNFAAELLTATGNGVVDLGGQTIKYRLAPVALAGRLKDGIRVPVIIEGPWSNIRFRPDLKALLDTELEAEKEKLKAQAKAKEDELRAKAKAREAELKEKAAAKLEDELGVVRKDGQSVEDALKEGLENKAKDALRGLLGGN
ncbi:AsmA protein [Litoreibacter ascidiaceicola]|uniref:AsmA protein n=1 Tax=Litoreibacter ascidiaceicola TaxID=1486859 RepID=A0A1M4YFI1_9RHOB|nr:AsmA family protein [Litoreibacter ascidiaceicola]SHF04418.1 AsmA protein [Litoreibacter ascidiaceicola]